MSPAFDGAARVGVYEGKEKDIFCATILSRRRQVGERSRWNAFVSGSSRAVVITDLRLGGEGETGGINMGMLFNITNRFQVRR